MSELAPNTADPFVVRAHHAELLWCMEYGGFSALRVADRLRVMPQSLPHMSEYRRDVLGTTAQEADTALGGMAAYLQRFMDLPAKAEVLFTSRQKDGICGSCITGSHCAIPKPSFDSDASWLTGLSRVAKSHKLNVTRTYEVSPASTFEKPTEIPTGLYTNARTARVLLGDSQLPLRAALPEYGHVQKAIDLMAYVESTLAQSVFRR